jgi:hypothetical protein
LVLCWLSCLGSLVLFWLSCLGSLVLFWLSCPPETNSPTAEIWDIV